jgi:DNA-binding response OmpR family regulator
MSLLKLVRRPAPAAQLPPLYGVELARPRVLAAIAAIGVAPVRILCAPRGAGKTTILHQYAALYGDAGVVAFPPNASRTQVTAVLAGLVGARLAVIDDADAASAAGRDALFEYIAARAPDGTRFLLGGSSRTRLRAATLVACGIADIIDGSVLPFTSAEIAQLAGAQHVAADELDIEQLTYDTDGWAVAVAWIVRDAAANGQALRGAFERWHASNSWLLLEYATESRTDPESVEAFVAAVRSGADSTSQRTLERLEAIGFPIVRMRTGLRPYRVFARIVGEAMATSVPVQGDRRLEFHVFGRLSCTIESHPVVFARRRDRNVLTYVALAPGATVTRAELLATFWPGASRSVGSQGLRTTLYRIRRAVANAAGCDSSRYVRMDDSISLRLEAVSIDARSFVECVERAEDEDAGGSRHAAREHYLQAEHLYTDGLLAAEAPESMLAPRGAEYRRLFEAVLTRLLEMCAQDGNARLHKVISARRAELTRSDARLASVDYEAGTAVGTSSSRSPIMTSI